jgi:hypothetical protein
MDVGLASATGVLIGSTEDQETGDLLRGSGLFDRFFVEHLVSLCIEGFHGLTFCKVARTADVF